MCRSKNRWLENLNYIYLIKFIIYIHVYLWMKSYDYKYCSLNYYERKTLLNDSQSSE